MNSARIADRILDRIEKDGTVHKSSIVEELELCLGREQSPASNDPLAAYLAHRYGLSDTWFKERSK